MKLMFASDIHGSAYYTQKLIDIYGDEKAEKLILLGDILYHGPRNDLPYGYEPKKVYELLNQISSEILCVRGNCDSEVDQMVLDFPIMADYMIMYLNGRMIFITHGHIYNREVLPKLKKGDVLIHGHTHEKVMKDMGEYLFINPGSLSLPKDDDTHSYMIYEDGTFYIKSIEGQIIDQKTI